MAGHSKWANIKHKKGATDAKRGKIFTKLIKEITVAARMGGGDPDGNPRLRTAVLAARAENMPKENVERAIKKGTGSLEGQNYEEIMYEGYGPAGVAILIDSVTDNKNRTVAEIRQILGKNSGNMGESGCVSWMFDKKGIILVEVEGSDEDTLMQITLDAGAEDIKESGGVFEIVTEPGSLESVRGKLEESKIPVSHAEVTMLPRTTVTLSGKDAEKMVRLYDALDDHDDVQKVYANFEIPDPETA
ncbi:MAG: YebC/PmpR family DNA-binding transcriptional regulator [Nitrospinota bacterium]